jgi:hypothetical protein
MPRTRASSPHGSRKAGQAASVSSERRRSEGLCRDGDSSADDPFPHQTLLFVGLMVATVALRLRLWLTSRRYLRSDEAVVGMQTLDILDGGPIPFFLYGQSYSGGHTVDALMAVPLVALLGPIDYLFKTGQVLFSCATVLVVYWCLYQSFGKRYALVAATCFSFFSTFVAFNFFYNAVMAMSFFGWLGLSLFFPPYFTGIARRTRLVGSGAAIGFASYCFEFALYFFAVVVIFALLRENVRIWTRWRAGLWFLTGAAVGAFPLVYYNLAHDFGHLRTVFGMTMASGSPAFVESVGRFGRLWVREMPAFFGLELDDIPAVIPGAAAMGYGLFVAATLYAAVRQRRAIATLLRALLSLRSIVLPREQRIVYLLLMTGIYALIYSRSSLAGTAERYLVIFLPLVPLIVGWTVFDLWKTRRVAAIVFTAAFAILQIKGIVTLARDTTTVEWRVRMQGEDLKTLTRFLLANNLTTVATPYEIKWRLMLESERRIVAAAYLFGFDREEKYNLEVVDRVNRQRLPLAFAFDKDHRFADVALHFNPAGAFSVDAFRRYLERNLISYEVTPVGQTYVVYHKFSAHVPLPDPYAGR